jgi:squalene-hopene/tetraprenyl-beta-curcumene cyclase
MSTLPQKNIEVSLDTFRDIPVPTFFELAEKTIRKAQQHLLGQQKSEGYWVGELLVDSTLVSDVVAFMHWTGEVDFNKQSRCVKYLLDRQMPDGGWNTYYRGPSELNATVKAYFALKLAGFSASDPRLVKAHATIVRLGGIPKSADHPFGDHSAPELAAL